jgi:predicted DCC family thiol-disulfide oxidoreductase YuxK
MQQVLPSDSLSLSAAGITKPVIFFDDVCIMCNTFVNLLLKFDRRQQFLFAPLHGETASKLLPPLPEDPGKWSMVYVDESGIHDQSDASLEVYRRLGGVWWLLSLARFIPRAIRNPVYRIIARNRYRWFGKRETCRIPSADEKARFLP